MALFLVFDKTKPLCPDEMALPPVSDKTKPLARLGSFGMGTLELRETGRWPG